MFGCANVDWTQKMVFANVEVPNEIVYDVGANVEYVPAVLHTN